jgi:hypothetical protein
MSKLFNLKEWLTIPEVARRLSTVFREEVSEADVLRLALGNKLKLSVKFVNYTTAIPVKEKDGGFLCPKTIDQKYAIAINGIYDFSDFACNSHVIEHEYHKLADGLDVKLLPFDDSFLLAKNKDGFWWLMDEENYETTGQWTAAYKLPANAVFVVRTEALREFETEQQGATDKPLGTTERDTLLIIIAALCREAKIGLDQRGATKRVVLATENLGAAISEETVRRHLNNVKNALEARMK